MDACNPSDTLIVRLISIRHIYHIMSSKPLSRLILDNLNIYYIIFVIFISIRFKLYYIRVVFMSIRLK